MTTDENIYPILIFSRDGLRIWTLARSTRQVVRDIKDEVEISGADERPTHRDSFDGIPAVINWDNVLSVARFPSVGKVSD